MSTEGSQDGRIYRKGLARTRPVAFIAGIMSDKIIDIGHYLDRDAGRSGTPATMALWGADGDRSRFALPLWRIVHLAQAERGVIFWRNTTGDPTPSPFVVIDLAHDSARLNIDGEALPHCEHSESATLHDLGPAGLLVCLGARDGRAWCLLADGGQGRSSPLEAGRREDVLFLAGECAGLLFLRDFADLVDDPTEE
ncbi:MAG: hypothetical protein OEM67_13555 [Thermoleophilia bacterium]|nr:hypothetical protein [Thermoleophilia bacterium]